MGHNESSPTLQPLTYDATRETRPPASSRRDAPLAIPDFVFPAQPTPLEPALDFDSTEQPSPASLNNQEFRFPARDDRPHRPAALPDFSFNPGASIPHTLNSPTLLSPPTSPHSPNPPPSSRPIRHGHRRGGSEFVGGSIRDGSSIAVMSTSPTKDGVFPQSLQPPPPRRGHRRGMSGAISTNDLPILQPPAMDWTPKGSSAPNSPTNFDQGIKATIPLADDPLILTALPAPVQEPPTPAESLRESDSSFPPSPKPARSTARARVGFSDTLEFIPRPLSLVSSDTSSTVTARPGHCMSESISSVVSPTSFGDDYSSAAPARNPTKETRESRPSTAGAILETVASPPPEQTNTSPRRRNSIPALIGVSEPSTADPALPSPTRAPKRWSFFGLETSVSTKTRPISSSSSDSVSRGHTVSSSDRGSDSDAANPSTPQRKKNNRKSRTQTVKGWAGSILPIKSKGEKRRRKPSAVRPPTPPPSVTPMDEDDDDEEDYAGHEPMLAPAVHIQPPEPPSLMTQLPRRPDEIMSPMIDLDAALGPFNTPLPHNPEWEAAQRAAGTAGRRRLHSAQGMKGFGGPGMHYHRRAESAPDLPPFDAGRAGINRFSSNSTMADVFEEEEEEQEDREEDEASDAGNLTAATDRDSRWEHKGENIIFSDSGSETTSLRGLAVRRKSSGYGDQDQSGARSVRAECSKTSLHESVILEEPTGLNLGLQSPMMPPSRRYSSDSGAYSPKRILHMPNSEPPPVDAVPLTLPQGASMPLSPYSISTASSHPSPRSPMSDAQRVSTAPSSVAEDNSFHSLMMGEPGPEVRISMDYDNPSIASSTSTMARDSGSYNPQARPQPSTLRDQRPSSVSSAAFGRRRSSLISLSRLISSSHGERSKLSTELTFEETGSRAAARSSRTKKLGRMMQFWKPSKPGPCS
ncbi:hypothetical protein V2A60_005298 [Cordyceps javanica]|uniref:Cell wall proline rich protein n=1 Tax=Cordyceps javanica TaxID=43265 RepID=A0A545W8Z0_9HYPO|nr:cell wall proline rich protein [Cordyceps javanica]TQW10457.1 cell wall proline rich protein [Cordyceps javanica]